jgi:general secretion pathway protein D
MKPLKSYAMALAYGLAGAGLFAGGAWAQEAQSQASSSNGAVALREVDIRAFIEDVSNTTGRTFIIDPRVTGRVTVLSQHTLSEQELFEVFLSTLRVNGYVAAPTAGGAYRIVPAAAGARDLAPNRGPTENTYVTHVFRLQFADAENVATSIRPMLSEHGNVTANRRGNSVVVVDYGSTISQLRDVIGRLDRDVSVYRSLRLRNTSAAEMARVAQSLAAAPGEEARSMLQAVPVISSNTLILRGDQRALDQVTPLIQELDASADLRSGVQVIPLRYAVAEDLVPILQQISSAMNETGAQAGSGANRRANIAAHRATNALIISADTETQEALANVVRSLDVRRQQILVEAIIVEVSDEAAHELGLQFLLADPTGSNAVPFLSTSYAGTAPNLLAVTGALVGAGDAKDPSPALADLQRAAISSILGSSGLVAGIGGTRNDGSILGLILNALSEDTESNVLSTPSVLTLDNETASILVGQQIPITTGEALGSDFQNQFRTVQREDVGVQLQVRPQISDGGAIRLEIKQEVSSIFGPINSGSTDLITNRRAIDTVVQVDAGQIIVLGGLIQEELQSTNSGVPYLRSIPLAGRLFSNEERSRRRTNLMVFLRPTIVNTPEQARQATAMQYRALQSQGGLDASIAARVEADLARDAMPAPREETGPADVSAPAETPRAPQSNGGNVSPP